MGLSRAIGSSARRALSTSLGNGGSGGAPAYEFNDADAAAYVSAVETADGQSLENGIKAAIDTFVAGCKTDSIWTAIKASCILAGARTLAGALVPLVGTAPTNSNFVSGDYSRTGGLLGNGTSKSIITNRNNNTDPQNSRHNATYITNNLTLGVATRGLIGTPTVASGGSWNLGSGSGSNMIFRLSSATSYTAVISGGVVTGFVGSSRSDASDISFRVNGASATVANASATPLDEITRVFNSGASFAQDRIAFYSTGESINLTSLDSRVSALVSAIGTVLA